MIRSKKWILASLVIAVLIFAACAPEAAAPAEEVEAEAEVAEEAPAAEEPAAEEKVIVGLSFSDFATERWPIEDELMTELLEGKRL